MQIESPAFKEGEKIPSLYTCEGKNISPPLTFSGVPKEAKSLVLIMDDPDVPLTLRPSGMFDHWVVFNIPPDVTHLPEGKTPPGLEGVNTKGDSCYRGPCPPDREHRYFFKLYALRCKLELPSGSTKEEVEKAMEKHILEQCQLMGTYELARK